MIHILAAAAHRTCYITVFSSSYPRSSGVGHPGLVRIGSSRGWGNPCGSDTPTPAGQGAGQDSVTRDIYFKLLIRQNG